MRKLILVLLFASLTACASNQERITLFTNPNPHNLSSDMASCNLEVQRIMANYRIYSTMFTYGWAVSNANDYAKNIFENCMMSKGYQMHE